MLLHDLEELLQELNETGYEMTLARTAFEETEYNEFIAQLEHKIEAVETVIKIVKGE